MTKVEFRVLGPFEVWVEGRALELKRRKQRALLALLMLNAGEVVSTDRLIEELWAGKPPKAAVGSVQNLVSDLRKALGREVVRTQQPGYVLELEPEQLDLHRFERLVAESGEQTEPGRRAQLLRGALDLWRGPALADLAFEPFLQVEIARLEELRTATMEELVGAELELGHHANLAGKLETLVAAHPLRERLRGQLMLALYRSGRQAEALEAYRAARATLVDELGIEPSPDLQRLEQAILRHDPSLDLSAEPPSGPAAAEERRKAVTILFADIVDSTSLSAMLDPEVLRAVMRRYFDTVRTMVERHGGTVEKFIGGAAMAVFGVPQLHEDDALRALRAAGELREALGSLNEELERDHGFSLRTRIGINTGEVLAGDASAGQPFATGMAVNLAMRLQQAALPDETLLGESTQRLLGGAAEVEPVEPIDTGGPHGAVPAYRLLEVGDGPTSRPLSGASFVGRTAELATLESAFGTVRDERRSRVAVVLGDAGIGKSRLASEFVVRLGKDAVALFGRCVSYGDGATYLPLAEIVRQVAPERTQATIASLLEGEQHAALVGERMAELTGESDGAAPTTELFWAVRRLFDALARRRPLVVVLEDLHWAEPTLLDLVEYLAAWALDSPLLILCLARPELRDARPGLGADADVIALEPLEDSVADALVSELGGPDVNRESRERIVAIAEGNPLFVEQLLAFAEEAGLEGLESVPPTVEALLASRLDRLELEERALLERAAVVGREFSRADVVHLTPPDELAGVDGRLKHLVKRGLIAALRAGGQDRLRFHHVLIRDVAYAGITKEERGTLHERFATWLERRDAQAQEIVGYHLEQAHRYRAELRPGDAELPALAERAGDQLAAAGIRAWKRADAPAAVNLLERATRLLPPARSDRVELLCELGVARRVLGDFDGGEKTLVEACGLAARDQRVLLRAQIELAFLRLLSETHGSSDLMEIAATAVPIFEELDDDRALGRTWRQVGYVCSFEGRLSDWKEAVERAVVHYRRSGWSASGCLGELAAALFYGPTPVPEALERCEELLDEASDRVGRANVLALMSGLDAIDGRFDDARQHLTEAETTYEELGETYARANYCLRVRGRIEMLAGDPASAEGVLRESCAILERVRDEAGLSTLGAELADALYARGRYDEAAGWLDLAEKRSSADDVSAQYTWRRVRAKVLARAGGHRDAERLAREAAELADRTDALSDHGNVLLDLAEVLLIAGKESAAAGQIERGLELFERKGNRVSAHAARARLSELALA